MKSRSLVGIALLIVVVLLGGCLFSRAPQAEFTCVPAKGYPPFTVHFDASLSSSPDGNIVSYAWDFGDGTSGIGRTTEHTFTKKGVYPVCLTVTDSTGAVGTVCHNVYALNRSPHAAFTYYPYMVGKGDPVYFDASASSDPDGEVVEYLWTFGDGTTTTGEYVEHIYTSAGGSGTQYPVTLTVVDDDGARDSVTQYVHVVGCDSCGG